MRKIDEEICDITKGLEGDLTLEVNYHCDAGVCFFISVCAET